MNISPLKELKLFLNRGNYKHCAPNGASDFFLG